MACIKNYWEDFQPGNVMTYGNKRLSREEIIDFAKEFDPELSYLDTEESMPEPLSASGWHSCSILMRMMCDGFILESAAMGAPGIDESRWERPVYAGDVLSARTTCLESRASGSRPEMGLVHFKTELLNQNGETCVSLRNWALYGRRNPGARVEKAEAPK